MKVRGLGIKGYKGKQAALRRKRKREKWEAHLESCRQARLERRQQIEARKLERASRPKKQIRVAKPLVVPWPAVETAPPDWMQWAFGMDPAVALAMVNSLTDQEASVCERTAMGTSAEDIHWELNLTRSEVWHIHQEIFRKLQTNALGVPRVWFCAFMGQAEHRHWIGERSKGTGGSVKREETKLYSLLNRCPMNNDPRECLRLVRKLRPRQRWVIERLMIGKTKAEIIAEQGFVGKLKRIIERGKRRLGVKTVQEIGRVWWSAMAIGVPWEEANPSEHVKKIRRMLARRERVAAARRAGKSQRTIAEEEGVYQVQIWKDLKALAAQGVDLEPVGGQVIGKDGRSFANGKLGLRVRPPSG